MKTSIKSKLCLLGLCYGAFFPQVNAAEVAGKTMVARGQVEATAGDAEKRLLKRRSDIFQNDVVITGESSNTQLRMNDGGMIALKENSKLVISEYQAGANGEKGSVVLDLVQGGLRSITGAIKADKGDYQLKTSIASIGIRGTHYEVELIDGVLWLAVWDGSIDVEVDIGLNSGNLLSLGNGENFAFASIDPQGNIATFLEPPTVFQAGMSTPVRKTAKAQQTQQGPDGQQPPPPPGADGQQPPPPPQEEPLKASNLFANLVEGEGQRFIPQNELNNVETQSIVDLVNAKQGSLSYGAASVNSSYNISNFTAGMTINFDTGAISNGNMSFDQGAGTEKWTAVFNGNMNVREDRVLLEVDVTYASHGDKLADGTINAGFIDNLGLDTVTGDFTLQEVESTTKVDGNYIVRRK